MSLIEKLPDFIAVRRAKLSTQEQELRDILSKGHKLLEESREINKINWNEYDLIIADACELMKTYDGRFKDYFTNSLKSLKVEEKLILNYSSPSF